MAQRCSSAIGSEQIRASVGPLPQIFQEQPQSQLQMKAMSSSDGPCQNRKCVQTRDDLNRKCEEVRRLEQEEMRQRDEEIKRLKSDYEHLEQKTKKLEATLESKAKEGDMKMLHEKVDKFADLIPLKDDCKRLHEKFDKFAAHIPLKDDYQKIMEKFDTVAVLEAEKKQLQAQYEIYIARLENGFHSTIRQYKHSQQHLEAENAKLKGRKFRGSMDSTVCQRRECVAREQKMKYQEKILQSAECTKPGCVTREQQMREQQNKLIMFSPMKEMAVQYDGQHDQLKKEYNELMTDPNLPAILGQLEEAFTDPFDAKVVLTKILMVAYDECKRVVIQSVTQYIEQLFTVQSGADEESGKPSDVDMEDLSRAYGLLLQATALNSCQACTTAMPEIYGKIKSELKTVEQLQSKTWEKKKKMLPLEKVVELTWKFVTQNNPLIVCQPETFHEDIQERDFHHWKPKLPKPYTLTYARPVLYRSYHGIIAGTGLVGNIPYKESSV